MEGYGVQTWPDGKEYEGHYYKGKKHGQGKMTWASGISYDGNWVDGMQEGEGVVSNPEQNRSRRGNWKKGKNVEWYD